MSLFTSILPGQAPRSEHIRELQTLVRRLVGCRVTNAVPAQPSVPATTVAYTNAFGYNCTVYVAGGTVTAIAVGGTATGLTSGTFHVGAEQTITVTYSSVPAWVWIAD